MEAAGTRLLDESQPFDVAIFDGVVSASYDPRHPERSMANEILMKLREQSNAWAKADAIIENSTLPQGRRWKILPEEQRVGIKGFIVNKIIQLSSDEATASAERTMIHQMNKVLVSILKQEWPHNWPSFIGDVCGASRTSEVLCENNMHILRLLSEEVFDFSKDAMTTAKIRTMKESLNAEFAQIFRLCEFTLVERFFAAAQFRNAALECLTEIASLSDLEPKYDEAFVRLYVGALQALGQIVPRDASLAAAFDAASGRDADQLFVSRLALFFSGFFKAHLRLVETREHGQALLEGLQYLVRISAVPDNEVFQICLDYWHAFSQDLYASETGRPVGAPRPGAPPAEGEDGFDAAAPDAPAALNLGGAAPHRFGGGPAGGAAGPNADRKALFQHGGLLSQARLVIISRMSKPEEVLVVEDENGEIVREMFKDTEAIAQYKTMRETLVYLTHLNYDDTESIMLDKLALQVDGTEWSWANLNTLCWAIGSISGAMSEDEEKRFLVTVIKDLLGLCEVKRGKGNKACIASNIMYVVGQYPRFLRAHWKFLKTVVNKLFEFMHELHPGVQDMACDTFLKIALKCKRKFVTQQPGRGAALRARDLVAQLPAIISDLEPHQVHAFYEATACLLSDRGGHPSVAAQRPALLAQLMALPNDAWRRITHDAQQNPATLVNPDTQHGDLATRHADVRALRAAKREILRLLTTFVENDVLNLLAATVDKLRDLVANEVPRVLDAVFEPTLRMITRNFEDFPEHRLAFFKLLKAVNTHCFAALFAIPVAHHKLVVDSVVWAFKHTERNVADTGLEILYELLLNVGRTVDDAKQPFYRAFAGHVTAPLFDDPTKYPSNQAFLRDHVANLLSTSFPNLSRQQIVDFVVGLFDLRMDLPTFKTHLRDFLIQLKEFSEQNNQDLYSEERAAAQQVAVAEQQNAARLAVPGLVNPHDRPMDDDDL
ncbi:hypothetical protein JL722_3186 [Aureococcus anophagefferens]|nr:hypothetical protein JL722_3186 [Aureococcus anophagefferens]